ncbi:hypothetical protein ISG10_35465, partial [Burkholderia pseudomallei]|nr:hypothetical protein [Burkholderia pseudomallei]
MPIQYTVGGAKGVERRERITLGRLGGASRIVWTRAAGAVIAPAGSASDIDVGGEQVLIDEPDLDAIRDRDVL